ncbi:glutamine--tRNA ligase-like protein, partial [Tanacetum coccineum]
MLLQYILSSKIKTPAQLDVAFSFLNLTGSENLLDINKFEQACGVGYTMSITPTLEINGEKNQWNIKVKITSLWNQYFTNNNQSGQSRIDMILMDEQACKKALGCSQMDDMFKTKDIDTLRQQTEAIRRINRSKDIAMVRTASQS